MWKWEKNIYFHAGLCFSSKMMSISVHKIWNLLLILFLKPMFWNCFLITLSFIAFAKCIYNAFSHFQKTKFFNGFWKNPTHSKGHHDSLLKASLAGWLRCHISIGSRPSRTLGIYFAKIPGIGCKSLTCTYIWEVCFRKVKRSYENQLCKGKNNLPCHAHSLRKVLGGSIGHCPLLQLPSDQHLPLSVCSHVCRGFFNPWGSSAPSSSIYAWYSFFQRNDRGTLILVPEFNHIRLVDRDSQLAFFFFL